MILAARFVNQRIADPQATSPAAVVRWFGAMQAQDFGAAQWAVGRRIRGDCTAAVVLRAFDRGSILRTHVLRPTWHFVAPQDIRWMLELTGPRVHRAIASYNKRLGVDAEVCVRAAAVFERALRDRTFLTRPELGERLRQNGLPLDNLQLTQAVMTSELDGVICSGPRKGKQFTYALLAERASAAVSLPRDEALSTLSRLFLQSHGPATFRDFAWWSGMTVSDAKRGFEMNRARRYEDAGLVYWTTEAGASETQERSAPLPTALLPVYDEYSVAYRDRVADPRSVVGAPFLVTDDGTVGTWRATQTAAGLQLAVVTAKALPRSRRKELADEVERYGRFRGLSCTHTLESAEPDSGPTTRS